MIALIIIGCIIVYFLIGFSLNVIFRLLRIIGSWDDLTGLMLFAWPVTATVMLCAWISDKIEMITSEICHHYWDKRDGK